MVREYDLPVSTNVWLCLANVCDPSRDEAMERAIVVAASLGVALAGQGCSIGLKAVGTELAPLSGQAGVAQLLDCLAQLELRRPDGSGVSPVSLAVPESDGHRVLVKPSGEGPVVLGEFERTWLVEEVVHAL